MERYKAFLKEINKENVKIRKKILFVNNKTKYKVVDGRRVNYNKYFVNSYETEKKFNVYKYYKHKIVKSKRKKKGVLDNYDFPFFEIYKNTNEAFKNNLSGYKIFKIIKNYDELQLFNFCSKRGGNGSAKWSYLFSHFIEIVIKKRDLYSISNLLLLTDNLKKLNYYNPYFCKLICREIFLDLHKIRIINHITRFLDFFMFFNIFNFYYLNKFYKYLTYFITQSNKWRLLPQVNNLECASDGNLNVNVFTKEIIEPMSNSADVHLTPIQNYDIITLSLSFQKYKMFDPDLLYILSYVCNHEAYPHLQNVETVYSLTQLTQFYKLLNMSYSSNLFFNLFKNVLRKKQLGNTNFVLLLRSYYNICKTFGTTFDLDTYNLLLKNYERSGEKKIAILGEEEATPLPTYVLSEWVGKKAKRKIKKMKRSKNTDQDVGNEGNQIPSEVTSTDKMEESRETNKLNRNEMMSRKQKRRHEEAPARAAEEGEAGRKVEQAPTRFEMEDNEIVREKTYMSPFNSDINSNLKKQNLNDSFLVLTHDYETTNPLESRFKDILNMIKYVILFIELKIISFFPFEKRKTRSEIEFFKRANFERDYDKNVYKYIAQNIGKEHSASLEKLLKMNKQKDWYEPMEKERSIFDDSNMSFLFYLNYSHMGENDVGKDMGNDMGNEWPEKFSVKQQQESEVVTLDDINRYIKSKKDIKFNLTDRTYFSHIFSHLCQTQLSETEEHILKNCIESLQHFGNNFFRLDVNDVADLFYSITVYQIVQGCQNGMITKNKYGYSKIRKYGEYDKLYRILSDVLIKKIININSENMYKVILSCANTAYTDVYLNHFLKNFNRHVKFSKMRKFMNC
ncbi:hypothetical protein, conserved [Plasmodium gonderi]|uniref:Uncharacterized protein n=1 Tax=Plasmodium gonderi TaxID=77519 RepID=A0A1Y1JFY4_PLAGO|nr:hypothetical protein, conserved [Plasmodium gonderi]GAW81431.1 hypothetical protein, conserved [Plasmodium gonderi]